MCCSPRVCLRKVLSTIRLDGPRASAGSRVWSEAELIKPGLTADFLDSVLTPVRCSRRYILTK